MDSQVKKGISVFDFMSGSIGMLVIAGVVLLGGGLGIVFGLPYALSGILVGVVASWVIIAGSFAGTRMMDKSSEEEVTLYSAFPTD